MTGRWYWRATRLQRAVTRSAADATGVLRNPSLPPDMRKSLATSAVRLAMADHTGLPNPVQLAGYKVNYLRRDLLLHLYGEIFVNTCYAYEPSSPAPIILDCGSNIGMAMLYFKRMFPGSHLTCFEPDPETFGVLRKNMEQNGLIGVELHCCALTGVEGTTTFFHSNEEVGSLLMSTHPERLSGSQIEVQSRALSPYIQDDVDLLKLDIEGSEHPVLMEVAEAGKLRQIRQMHIEYHHHIRAGDDRLSATLALLESEGFGYQIDVDRHQKGTLGGFQDIALHAYRKG